MSAPPPVNLHAMADAWNDPIAFAAQLNAYYRQLEQCGYRIPDSDITTTNERER